MRRFVIALVTAVMLIGFAPSAGATTVSSTSSYCQTTRLYMWSNNHTCVALAQKWLNRNHRRGQLVVDGIYGPAALSMIERFQQSQYPHLTVDGIVGPNTWYYLSWCYAYNSYCTW